MATKSVEPLIVIVGPTASGKSALAMRIAQLFDGEIICADSRTIFRGMDIGTAKPTKEDQALVPHHLLDIVDPDQTYTVADFKKQANEAMRDIHSRGKLPILVGGSGLYLDAVIFDYDFLHSSGQRDTVNPRHLDPSIPRQSLVLRPNTLVIGLQVDPEALRKKISQRVEAMLEAGLVNEIRSLAQRYGWQLPAMQAPAYKSFRGYIEGSINVTQAAADFAMFDARLAKKQRTWFKRNNSIQWLTDPSKAVDIVTTFLNTQSQNQTE